MRVERELEIGEWLKTAETELEIKPSQYFALVKLLEDFHNEQLHIAKEQKVETSTEPDIVGNTELAVRRYQIDFGIHLRCKIKVTDNGIEVEGAMNGWGDHVPLDEVVVVEEDGRMKI